MLLFAVDGFVPLVWRVACAEGVEGTEATEGFRDVVGHREVDVAIGPITPVERHAQELGACAIDCCCVEVVQGVDEVVEVGVLRVFDAEIVHYEGELDGVCCVLPEGGGPGDRVVSERGEVVDEAVLCDSSCLFETRNTLPDLHVHVPIFLNRFEIIFTYNLIGDEGDGHTHVFVCCEGGAVVEFGKVDGSESCGWVADGAVDEALHGGDGGACGRCVAIVLESVATGGESHAIWLFFEGSQGRDQACVGDLAAVRDGARR